MTSDFPSLLSRIMAGDHPELGDPPPLPPGYGRGIEAPEWYQPDTFTGRRYQLWRVRSVMWQTLQSKLASDR